MTFTWTKHSPTALEYVSDDLCACVWCERVEDVTLVNWDVSGPRGRGTITGGSVPISPLSTEQRLQIARRLAEVYIAGFRRGRDGRPRL